MGLTDSTLSTYFSVNNSFYKYLPYERIVSHTLAPTFRERYVDIDGANAGSSRQLISIPGMSMLVHGALDARNLALILLLATGVRWDERIQIAVFNIDWEGAFDPATADAETIELTVFVDGEFERVLH